MLKSQLSARDKELAELRHLHGSGAVHTAKQKSVVVPVPDHDTGRLSESKEHGMGELHNAEVMQTEPGYMELLGWTKKRRRSGKDHLTQSDDVWHIGLPESNNSPAFRETRNTGELLEDAELLYQCALRKFTVQP